MITENSSALIVRLACLVCSACLFLAGCEATDGELVLATQQDGLQADGQGEQQSGNCHCVDGLQDFAAGLFDAAQSWQCQVFGAATVSEDTVTFQAGGLAAFDRFGTLYWNRDLQAKALQVHSPLRQPFRLHTFFISPQTLQFNLDDSSTDALVDEVYDCAVLSE